MIFQEDGATIQSHCLQKTWSWHSHVFMSIECECEDGLSGEGG